jgi:glycosyltransferase involved in cell wall biosynthesis
MRILLLTRHFPPHVSGGARRPFGFVRGLLDAGHEVFTVAPALPDGVPGFALTHAHASPAETALPKEAQWKPLARELLLWPDPDIRWSRRAGAAALEACPFAPDWIITTSPPESVLAAGRALKRATGARWLHDFRDHWLVHPFRATRRQAWRAAGERALARRWLRDCDGAIAVNEAIAKEIKAYAPHLPIKIIGHFAIAQTASVALPAGQINLVHTGSLSLSDPGTRIDDLLGAFRSAFATAPSLHLHLVGRLTDVERAAILQSGLAAAISMHGVQPLDIALAYQAAAHGLVLVGAPDCPHEPGKAAEYRAAEKPIIAIGAPSWTGRYNQGASATARMIALAKGALAPASGEPGLATSESATGALVSHMKSLGGTAERRR